MLPAIGKCKWPPLPEHYSIALQDAVEFVFARFNSVIGIIAAGTIVRGTPSPSSDLDIYVVHTDSFRQRIQRFSRKVPTEIFVNPPSMIRKYFTEEVTSGRLITAHMLSTGFVVYQDGPELELLRQEASTLIGSDPPVQSDQTYPKYILASLFEDAFDVCKTDPATSRMILSQAMEQTVRFAFSKAGKHQPRTKDLLLRLSEINSKAGALAKEFFTVRSYHRQVRLAESFAELVLGHKGFFEWETSPEKVL
jgi:hypothetical protein